ncbi:MAG: glycosyltransferase family 9 protein [Flavobacteriia bacterium]|nr:glycosyltransferase family 9 protein [Flavobacteriia bacterium]
MQKILIIQTAFLGDVILATPVLAELKRIYPEAKIDFLVRKGNESLLTNNPKCNQIFILDKQKGKLKNIQKLILTFRKNKYDLVVNLHRFASTGIITAFSGAKKKYGFKKNPLSFLYSKVFEHSLINGKHEVERNLTLIEEFGAKKNVRPELYPTNEQYQKIDIYCQDDFYCIAPASVWFTKQLPVEKWIDIVNNNLKHNKVYLIGGPNDTNLCQTILNQSQHKNCVNLAGKLNLLESAALISKAKRTFVNDSGPLHIASAMNAPVTAFFCSTILDFGFGPLSDQSLIKEVTDLPCKPCGIHGHKICPEGHFKCGFNIDLKNID